MTICCGLDGILALVLVTGEPAVGCPAATGLLTVLDVTVEAVGFVAGTTVNRSLPPEAVVATN